MKYLDGIDTIAVSSQFGPGTDLVFKGYASRELFFQKAVRKIFASQPWISVLCSVCSPPEYFSLKDDGKKPNVMHLIFIISVREEIVKGQPVRTAALSVVFQQSRYYEKPATFSPVPVTYPFALPDTEAELDEKLADGARYLIDFLPHYLCGKNPKGSSCKAGEINTTYLEKLPSATIPKPAAPEGVVP